MTERKFQEVIDTLNKHSKLIDKENVTKEDLDLYYQHLKTDLPNWEIDVRELKKKIGWEIRIRRLVKEDANLGLKEYEQLIQRTYIDGKYKIYFKKSHLIPIDNST
jgi:hypothetical protein